MDGYEDGSFRPGSSVTAGEALKLILLAAGFPVQERTGAHWASVGTYSRVMVSAVSPAIFLGSLVSMRWRME